MRTIIAHAAAKPNNPKEEPKFWENAKPFDKWAKNYVGESSLDWKYRFTHFPGNAAEVNLQLSTKAGDDDELEVKAEIVFSIEESDLAKRVGYVCLGNNITFAKFNMDNTDSVDAAVRKTVLAMCQYTFGKSRK